MSDDTETAILRLWRDRVQMREQERNEAMGRLRIAEEKIARLMAENDRLRVQLEGGRDADSSSDDTVLQMQALKDALLPLLSDSPEPLTQHAA